MTSSSMTSSSMTSSSSSSKGHVGEEWVRGRGMMTRDRRKLLSGAAGLMLCLKVAITLHGSLRLGATTLMESMGVEGRTEASLAPASQPGGLAGNVALATCCHSSCGGMWDTGALCNCCPGAVRGKEADYEDDGKGKYGTFAGVVPPVGGSTCCQASCNGVRSNDGSYKCGCCQDGDEADKTPAADQKNGVWSGALPASSPEPNTKYGVFGGAVPPSTGVQCCQAECNGVRSYDGTYSCGCCPDKVYQATAQPATTGAPLVAPGAPEFQSTGGQPLGKGEAKASGQPADMSGHADGRSSRLASDSSASNAPAKAGGQGAQVGDHHQGARQGERQHAITRHDDGQAEKQRGGRPDRGGAPAMAEPAAMDGAHAEVVDGNLDVRAIPVYPQWGTNEVFQGTRDEGGVHRVRRGRRFDALSGRISVESLEGETGNSTSASEARRPLSWDKSWWPAKGWALWALSGPTLTLLIFVLNSMTQGWECGLIYAGILLPLDIMTFYFDLYAYDEGELYWFELFIALALNTCLCTCLIPAYTASQMMDHERRSFGGGHYDPYGFPPPGYGATMGGGGGGYQAWRGEGQSTGYGVRTERTQLV